MPDITKIADEKMKAAIIANLQAGERHRRVCYINDREGQLQRFNFGYAPDWSQAEIIAAISGKIKTLRKAAKRQPYMDATLLLPMLRAAWSVECERAQEEVA